MAYNFINPYRPAAPILARAGQIPPATPEESESVLGSAARTALSGVGYVGGTLDKLFGRRALAGLLDVVLSGGTSGQGWREMLSIIPFSDTLGVTDPTQSKSYGEVLRANDLGWENQQGLDWGDLGDFLLDVVGDPGTYITGGLTQSGKVLTPAGRVAESAGLLKRMSQGGYRAQALPEEALSLMRMGRKDEALELATKAWRGEGITDRLRRVSLGELGGAERAPQIVDDLLQPGTRWIGPREGMRTRTLSDVLLDNPGSEADILAAMGRSGVEGSEAIASMMQQPLSAMAGIGIPFRNPSRLLGEAAGVGSDYSKFLDQLGRITRFNPVSRRVANIIGRTVPRLVGKIAATTQAHAGAADEAATAAASAAKAGIARNFTDLFEDEALKGTFKFHETREGVVDLMELIEQGLELTGRPLRSVDEDIARIHPMALKSGFEQADPNAFPWENMPGESSYLNQSAEAAFERDLIRRHGPVADPTLTIEQRGLTRYTEYAGDVGHAEAEALQQAKLKSMVDVNRVNIERLAQRRGLDLGEGQIEDAANRLAVFMMDMKDLIRASDQALAKTGHPTRLLLSKFVDYQQRKALDPVTGLERISPPGVRGADVARELGLDLPGGAQGVRDAMSDPYWATTWIPQHMNEVFSREAIDQNAAARLIDKGVMSNDNAAAMFIEDWMGEDLALLMEMQADRAAKMGIPSPQFGKDFDPRVPLLQVVASRKVFKNGAIDDATKRLFQVTDDEWLLYESLKKRVREFDAGEPVPVSEMAQKAAVDEWGQPIGPAGSGPLSADESAFLQLMEYKRKTTASFLRIYDKHGGKFSMPGAPDFYSRELAGSVHGRVEANYMEAAKNDALRLSFLESAVHSMGDQAGYVPLGDAFAEFGMLTKSAGGRQVLDLDGLNAFQLLSGKLADDLEKVGLLTAKELEVLRTFGRNTKMSKDQLREIFLGGAGHEINRVRDKIFNELKVPEALIADAKHNPLFASEDFGGAFMRAYDKALSMFRGWVTVPFMKFLTRNLGTGMVQQAATGSFYPTGNLVERIVGPFRDATAFMQGKAIQDAVGLANMHGAGVKTEEAAMRFLRAQAAAYDVAPKYANISNEHLLGPRNARNVMHELHGTDIPGMGINTIGESPWGAIKGYFQGWNPFHTGHGERTLAEMRGEGKSFWQWLGQSRFNPANMRGLTKASEDAGHSLTLGVRGGEQAAEVTEGTIRLATWLAQLRRGKGMGMASEIANSSHVNYLKANSYERHVMKRLFPFYMYSRGMAEWALKDLGFIGEKAATPGLTRVLVRAQKQASETVPDTPDWIANQASIPLMGVDEEGYQKFLTADLPFTGPLNLIRPGHGALDTVSGTLRNVLGQTTPILKEALEIGFNEQLHTGRPLDELEGRLDHLLQTVSGGYIDLPQSLSIALEEAANMTGGQALASEASRLMDDRKSFGERLFNLVSGARINDVNLDFAKDRQVDELLRQATLGEKEFRRYSAPYIRYEDYERMSPRYQALARVVMAESRRRSLRARERRAAIGQ